LDNLNERQQQIIEFIQSEVQKKGYPPSVREIGKAVGLSSSSSVHAHLGKLEKLGYLRRDPTKPRAIEVLVGGTANRAESYKLINVPIVGTVTAGQPIFAEQNIIDYFMLPPEFAKNDDVFMLKVQGDSMINAGIYEGDLVIVNPNLQVVNGEIVVALTGNEATIKRFYQETNFVRLQPENDLYEAIIVVDVKIIGKVTGLIRRIH